MNQDTILVITFGLILFIAYQIRRWYLLKQKSYQVSTQIAGRMVLTISDHNPKQDNASLSLHFKRPQETEYKPEAAIEFLLKKGDFDRQSFESLGIEPTFQVVADSPDSWVLEFEKRDLLKAVREKEIKLNRFRFVVMQNSSPAIKSHVFMFSEKFMLIIVERGKHN